MADVFTRAEIVGLSHCFFLAGGKVVYNRLVQGRHFADGVKRGLLADRREVVDALRTSCLDLATEAGLTTCETLHVSGTSTACRQEAT